MTVVLAMVKMLGIVCGMVLVDRAGRRPLLVNGSLGMFASLICLSVGAGTRSVFLVCGDSCSNHRYFFTAYLILLIKSHTICFFRFLVRYMDSCSHSVLAGQASSGC